MLNYKVIGMFNVQYHCKTMILYNMSILICIAVAVPVLKKIKNHEILFTNQTFHLKVTRYFDPLMIPSHQLLKLGRNDSLKIVICLQKHFNKSFTFIFFFFGLIKTFLKSRSNQWTKPKGFLFDSMSMIQ